MEYTFKMGVFADKPRTVQVELTRFTTADGHEILSVEVDGITVLSIHDDACCTTIRG